MGSAARGGCGRGPLVSAHRAGACRRARALAGWARQLAFGAELLRVGNLEVQRAYLDVRDAASAYRQGRPGEVYNVATGRPIRMGDLLAGLINAFGSTATGEVEPCRLRGVGTPVFVPTSPRLWPTPTGGQRVTSTVP